MIPCPCRTPYVDETGHLINQRIHENAANIKHRMTHSSTLVEHVEKTKHHIYIEDT